VAQGPPPDGGGHRGTGWRRSVGRTRKRELEPVRPLDIVGHRQAAHPRPGTDALTNPCHDDVVTSRWPQAVAGERPDIRSFLPSPSPATKTLEPREMTSNAPTTTAAPMTRAVPDRAGPGRPTCQKTCTAGPRSVKRQADPSSPRWPSATTERPLSLSLNTPNDVPSQSSISTSPGGGPAKIGPWDCFAHPGVPGLFSSPAQSGSESNNGEFFSFGPAGVNYFREAICRMIANEQRRQALLPGHRRRPLDRGPWTRPPGANPSEIDLPPTHPGPPIRFEGDSVDGLFRLGCGWHVPLAVTCSWRFLAAQAYVRGWTPPWGFVALPG